ncbi:MAG: ATP-dependent helicase [Candidatus Bipolaricaulia bacterium]
MYAARDELDEANYVAREIEHLWQVEGVELGNIAILYRVNTLSRAPEEGLIARGIPYEVVRGLRFYERMEVKDLLSYLRLIVNPADELSLLRAINRPRRGLGEGTVAAIKARAQREGISLWEGVRSLAEQGSLRPSRTAHLQEFVELIEGLQLLRGELGPSELAEEVLERTGYLRNLEGDPGAEERLGNIGELVGQLREYEGLEEFLEGVALLSEADGYSGEEGKVALLTLHAAKGLEFEVLFIIGLEEGLLPHARAIQDGELEEERRLAYVGMTRAKDRLYLSYAAHRSLYGSPMQGRPSRFLAELPRAELEGLALESGLEYGH